MREKTFRNFLILLFTFSAHENGKISTKYLQTQLFFFLFFAGKTFPNYFSSFFNFLKHFHLIHYAYICFRLEKIVSFRRGNHKSFHLFRIKFSDRFPDGTKSFYLHWKKAISHIFLCWKFMVSPISRKIVLLIILLSFQV